MKRKRFITSIIFAFTVLLAKSNEIGINSITQIASSNMYDHGYGIGLDYQYNIATRNRFGISASLTTYKRDYNNIYTLSSNGHRIIEKVNPNSKSFSIDFDYGYKLYANKIANIYFGTEFGLAYFKVEEDVVTIEDQVMTEIDYYENNKPKVGFYLEFEVNNIINENFSAYCASHYNVTFYEMKSIVMKGDFRRNEPIILGASVFSLGIRYKFQKSKME